jgi:hypothetical protein
MPRWLFVVLLLLQTHFAVSILVPLDSGAQREFRGLLRWAWPWSDGDSGPLGQVTTASGIPLAGLFLAFAAGFMLVMAIMAVYGLWVPESWWRVLTMAGAAGTILLFLLFPGLTRLIPMAMGGLLIWIAYSSMVQGAWSTAVAD